VGDALSRGQWLHGRIGQPEIPAGAVRQSLEGQLERIEDGIPRPIGMRGTGGPTVDARAACPLGDGDHPMAAFLGRSHPGPGQILASGRLAGHASTGAPIRYCLPARHRTASYCLCTNMWITCAQRRRACAYAVEMLGIPLPGRSHDRAFTWESASRILCMQRKPELSTCHSVIDNK